VTAITLAAAGALLMIATSAPSTGVDPVKTRLQLVASRAILFGHQSVGGNVLEGLRAVAKEQGVELRIAEVQSAKEVQPGTFGHVLVAANGEPRRKLASFTSALGGADPDLALVKFCYVDFDARTDAKALFADYQATLRDLRARHPRTTFVHVTVPLAADEGLLKSLAKKILGKTSGAVPANARRSEFNALLRSAFAGEPLFDLAAVESTDGAGRAVSAKLDGQPVPMLAPEYTDDGGHLNAAGSRRAALALVDVLATALAARPKGADDARTSAR
jgi:hypothetical protein